MRAGLEGRPASDTGVGPAVGHHPDGQPVAPVRVRSASPDWAVASPLDLLSHEELQAAVLDGELFRVGDEFASIGVPDDAVLRARGFASAMQRLGYAGGDGLLAERLSAAWIWGATSRPPNRHTACAPVGARRRGPFRGVEMRETRVAPDEVMVLGDDGHGLRGVGVTTPERTVLDLLRDRSEFGAAERAAVAGLLRGTTRPPGGAGGHGGLFAAADLHDVRRALEASTGLPFGRQALRRLATVVVSPALPSSRR